jgi:predicted nucleic acid-binding protein
LQTILTIDDALFDKALSLARPGIEQSDLLTECINAFIQRQTYRRLAELGGQIPEMQLASRRREDMPKILNVLVDTSLWVEHFKQTNEHLLALFEGGRVLGHPFVVAEIACGTPSNRLDVIGRLQAVESARVATQSELLQFIEQKKLFGKGCGFVDVHLIASALLQEETLIWSLDRRLDAAALELGLSFRPH